MMHRLASSPNSSQRRLFTAVLNVLSIIYEVIGRMNCSAVNLQSLLKPAIGRWIIGY